MPRYWDKAANFFKDFVKSGFKDRFNPLSVTDEAILDTPATADEIKEAKHLPFLQAVGILSYPASNCKFEIRYAISIIGSRRVGWSAKQFGIAVKLFEYCLTTKEMGLMYSNGLDPHGKNILYSYGDANLRLPRPQGCRIGMMNSAAVSMTSKKHTRTSPATSSAELKTAFDTSTDMLGLRNLLSELGNPQIKPTILYQDNTAAIQISNNRGSLGKASRAMDLETLTIRNRIEDHQIATQYCSTLNMIADIGTKALPEAQFVKLRDMMNGYAIVKAKYPDLSLPDYVFTHDMNAIPMSYAMVVEMISQQPYDFDLQDYYNDSDEFEEEEEDGDTDASDDDEVSSHVNAMDTIEIDEAQMDAENIHQSSSVVVDNLRFPDSMDIETIKAARLRRQYAPTLPRTWDEYYYQSINTNKYQDHPDFDNVSPRDFYNTVSLWPWSSIYGHMAPPGQQEVAFALRKDTKYTWQLAYSERFTFDELPDPRLYGIDETDLLSRVKEYKLREDNWEGYRSPTDYWTWMKIFEQEHVQLIRNKHMTSLRDDPHMVLEANPVVGNLLFPGSMDRDQNHPTKRFEARKLFGDLYLQRAKLLAEVMTQSEVQESVQWDDCSRPSPKASWIRFERWQMYFWHRYERLLHQPGYVPKYVNPEPLHDLQHEYRRMASWVRLNPITGHYQMLPNITHDIIPTGRTMFNECIDATQWFLWKLWPMSGITVYPTGYAELKSDIPEIQDHLNAMRASNPTWGRSLLAMNNEGWGTNN
jgi:hypothetical protein